MSSRISVSTGYPYRVAIAHSLSQQCPALPECVAELRHALDDYLAGFDISVGCRDDVRLAASEAISNSVVHAYRFVDPGEVTLTAHLQDELLTVIVTDTGCGMHSRLDSPGLGLGLPLIAQLAASLEIDAATGEGQGSRVTMTFNAHGA